jgi:hypothetical protein
MRNAHVCWWVVGALSLGLLRAENPTKASGPASLATQDAPPLLRVPESRSADTPPPAQPPPPTAMPAPTVPFSQKTPSSISSNKQFHVYGGDLQLRGVFCMLCEDTASGLSRVLKDGGNFTLPVFVVLRTPPDIEVTGPPVTLGISELSYGGFHLQINAQYRTGFKSEDFTRELVKLLLAERILRNHKRLSTTREGDVLPAWVRTGVSQALEYRSRSRPSALFSAVFRRGDVFSLDRIFSADPAQLDALHRGIYETSACALVLTLLDQPDGPVRFARFLNDLAVASKPDRDLLAQHFPNLATSKSALEKWWSLQMASLASPTAMDSLSVSRTEEELETALTLQIPSARRDEQTASAKPRPAPQPPAPTKPAEAEPAAPPEAKEESGDRKPRNFFGWMKRGSKDEPKEESKPDERQKPDEAKAPDKKSSAVETESTFESFAMGVLEVESYLDISVVDMMGFFGGEKVALFKKKQKPVDEAVEPEKGKEGEKKGNADNAKAKESSDKKAPAPAEPAKPAKPEKTGKSDDAAKPKTEEAPTPALSRKPGQARSIGTRPEDLPKAPPQAPVLAPAPAPPERKSEKADKPPEDDKKKVAEKAKENVKSEPPKEEDKPERRGLRNWFRKDSDEKGKGEESKDAMPQEAPKTESRPETAHAPSRPAPAPVSRAPKPGSIPLEDFALIAKRSDRGEILNRCHTRLSALKLRSHPLYKPIVTEYADLVQEMAQGKTRNAAEKLEGLRRQRDAILAQAAAVESHLDWYEANHTGSLSHAFDDFLKLDQQLEKDRLPRNDAISKELDNAQKEFEPK